MTRIAMQTVYHDRDRPSHIVLPVIEGAGADVATDAPAASGT